MKNIFVYKSLSPIKYNFKVSLKKSVKKTKREKQGKNHVYIAPCLLVTLILFCCLFQFMDTDFGTILGSHPPTYTTEPLPIVHFQQRT